MLLSKVMVALQLWHFYNASALPVSHSNHLAKRMEEVRDFHQLGPIREIRESPAQGQETLRITPGPREDNAQALLLEAAHPNPRGQTLITNEEPHLHEGQASNAGPQGENRSAPPTLGWAEQGPESARNISPDPESPRSNHGEHAPEVVYSGTEPYEWGIPATMGYPPRDTRPDTSYRGANTASVRTALREYASMKKDNVLANTEKMISSGRRRLSSMKDVFSRVDGGSSSLRRAKDRVTETLERHTAGVAQRTNAIRAENQRRLNQLRENDH